MVQSNGKNRHLIQIAMMSLSISLLASCAMLAPKQQTDAHFQLTGKIAITQGSETNVANLVWINRGDHYEAILYDALGREQFILKGTPQTMQIALPNGQTITPAPPVKRFLTQLVQFIQALPRTPPDTLPKTYHLVLSHAKATLILYERR